MPTYQYACTECGHRFEEVQAFTDASLTECPQCRGRLRKVFGSVGVVFKGSGFYRTDSRSDSSKKGSHSGSTAAAAKSDSGSSGDASGSGTSSDGGSSATNGSSTSGSSSTSSSSSVSSSSSPSPAKAAAS